MTQQVSHQHLDMTGGLNLSPQTQTWGFPKMEVPKNRWFIKDNPTKMEDLGVPLFWETSISLHALEQTISMLQSKRHLKPPFFAGIVESKIHDPTSKASIAIATKRIGKWPDIGILRIELWSKAFVVALYWLATGASQNGWCYFWIFLSAKAPKEII